MDVWLPIFRDLGFPAAVAIYVLVRLDRRLQGIEKALWSLLEWHRRYAPIPQPPPREDRARRG